MSNQPKPVTRESVLAAILAGDRTKQDVADRFGIGLSPVRDYRDQAELDRNAPARTLSAHLDALVCDDLLCMKVVDRQWHYLPTKKALAMRQPQGGDR